MRYCPIISNQRTFMLIGFASQENESEYKDISNAGCSDASFDFFDEVTNGTKVVLTELTVVTSSCKSASGAIPVLCCWCFGTQLSEDSICLLILLAIFIASQIISIAISSR